VRINGVGPYKWALKTAKSGNKKIEKKRG
jgi:hypothetical protein